ncbi:MAG: CoA-binding protein [Alcaligenaceae bacterium]|nr:MAG: CoA-binding protein [Alcaligenaceae bacterium]
MKDQLGSMFKPRGIALVGASDRYSWTQNLVAGLKGFSGPVYAVNPRKEVTTGLPVVGSLSEIEDQIDLVFAMTGPQSLPRVLDEASAISACQVIALTGGYAETGFGGRDLQRNLVEQANDLGIALLGPNSLGYVDLHSGNAPFAAAIPEGLHAGGIGLVLQSGAVAHSLLSFAAERAIGVGLTVSMGNEAVVHAEDVLEYVLAQDEIRSAALFIEQIRDPERFAKIAYEAARVEKSIVALKTGVSLLGTKVAQAHTGAVVGDDNLVDAFFRRCGVVRVSSLEELMTTAAILTEHGDRIGKGRVAFVSLSGGACELVADLAEKETLALPKLPDETASAIQEMLPANAIASNPLDVTGAVTKVVSSGELSLIESGLEMIAECGSYDVVLYLGLDIPVDGDEGALTVFSDRAAHATRVRKDYASAIIPITNVSRSLGVDTRDILSGCGLSIIGGIDVAMRSLGHAVRWVNRRESVVNRGAIRWVGPSQSGGSQVRSLSEWESRKYMAVEGVPFVPASLAKSKEEAVRASSEHGYPVVLKLCSPDLIHKSDIGGVELSLQTDEEVSGAYDRLICAATQTGLGIDGVLVSPMRAGGVELFVGLKQDPVFGPAISLGLGGIWIEHLHDVQTRILPVSVDDVKEMLSELRGAAVLTGGRNQDSVDLHRLSEAVFRFGELAVSRSEELAELEINPLWASGDHVEALDAVVTLQVEKAGAAVTPSIVSVSRSDARVTVFE